MEKVFPFILNINKVTSSMSVKFDLSTLQTKFPPFLRNIVLNMKASCMISMMCWASVSSYPVYYGEASISIESNCLLSRVKAILVRICSSKKDPLTKKLLGRIIPVEILSFETTLWECSGFYERVSAKSVHRKEGPAPISSTQSPLEIMLWWWFISYRAAVLGCLNYRLPCLIIELHICGLP